jgi:hypothetical protein
MADAHECRRQFDERTQLLLAEVAELREQAKRVCERTQILRRDQRSIGEAASAQSRSLIIKARRLARANSS